MVFPDLLSYLPEGRQNGGHYGDRQMDKHPVLQFFWEREAVRTCEFRRIWGVRRPAAKQVPLGTDASNWRITLEIINIDVKLQPPKAATNLLT